jgi:hypothetical protein
VTHPQAVIVVGRVNHVSRVADRVAAPTEATELVVLESPHPADDPATTELALGIGATPGRPWSLAILLSQRSNVASRMYANRQPSAHERVSLARLRALLDRASAPTENTALARMEAVVVLDFACEAAMKMALRRATNLEERKYTYFHDLLKKLQDAAGPGVMRHADQARLLHDARTRALHELRGPDETYVADIGPAVRAFVASVVQFGWGLDFDSIRLADAIQDERLRDLVRKAEESLNQGDQRNATLALAVARSELQTRLSYARSPSAWRGNWATRLSRGIDSTVGAVIRSLTQGAGTSEARHLGDDFGELGATLDRALAEVEAIAMGLATKELRWFHDVVPNAVQFVGGSVGVFVPEALPSLANLRRALLFLTSWIEAAEPLPALQELGRRADDPQVEMVRLPPDWPKEPESP